jgi:hypothetical protein
MTTYRFYPWARRGLSAALPAASGGKPPARGLARVKITITPEIIETRDVRLFGPGEVLGIDHRTIVRTEPRAGTADFEPNYLASIDFDPPELPWLFTPAGPTPNAPGRLAPWVVLVVLDRDRVAPPRVARNRPLPFITLPGALPDTELPPLEDSWSWAHVQRIVRPGEAGSEGEALAQAPDLNVSRLMCPRRLAPNRRWLACVVPAWDAGVAAGLGVARRDPEGPLEPAWSPGRSDLELPVYFHWEFDTGVTGDFEFLARRLKPVRATVQSRTEELARRARIYLGTADDRPETLAALPPDDPQSYARLDAPLEIMDQPAAEVAETPQAFSAVVERATTQTGGEAAALLPPLYGERHAQRFHVATGERSGKWLDELNLDPRTRIAARYGGDTVRRFQEELMEVAWQQIGDVLAANEQLGRSRFLALVATRALERHVVGLPAARILALSAHMHARLRADPATVTTRIARTSLADAAFAPAMRRLTSPVAPLATRTARAVSRANRNTVRHALSRGIAEALQRSEVAVDPSITSRDGIEGLELGLRIAREQGITPGQRWTTGADAANLSFDAGLLAQSVGATEWSAVPRGDLASVGVLGEAHFDALARIAAQEGVPLERLTGELRAAVAAAPKAERFAFRRNAAGAATLVAIERESGGAVVMVDPASRARTMLFTLEGTATRQPRALEEALSRTPRAVLREGAHTARVTTRQGQPRVAFEVRERPPIDFGRGGRTRRPPPEVRVPPEVVRIEPETILPAEEQLFTAVMPAPWREAKVVQAVTSALADLAGAQPSRERTLQFVRAPLGGGDGELAARVRTAIEPATVFRRRAAQMVRVPDWLRNPARDALDTIMAAPALHASFADLFARVAPERFLPRDIELPDESISALGTNPRFVAAFMVGVNHEMNRELIWRTYPTDGRGTPATRFWNWLDAQRRDVAAIHAWPAAGPLVSRLTNAASQVVLVVRGRLLRRYPHTIVLAWKAHSRGRLADVPAGDAAARRTVLREPLFKVWLEPDTSLIGFDLTREEFTAATGAGWYIVLQEPITEPRFGLDEPITEPPVGFDIAGSRTPRRRNVNDLNWSDSTVPAGGHLRTSSPVLGNAAHSADVAERLLQRPVRVAFHSTQIAPAFGAES